LLNYISDQDNFTNKTQLNPVGYDYDIK